MAEPNQTDATRSDAAAAPEENSPVIEESEIKTDTDTFEAAGTDASETDADDAQAEPEPASELDLITAEKNRIYDQLLRRSAEFDNYKKRSQRQMDDFRKFANESLLKDLLAIIDNLDRALEAGTNENGDSTSIREGVDMTRKELIRVLEKYKVMPIQALDQPFDPKYHQAMMQEPSDQHPENTVIREFQTGYTLHDRLLRPSMVVVSTASPAAEKEAAD
ncbi:MAG: nucleotide exchange factor GrpE [Deltaproteobacteria bacterium]|nr:MAG: nucleotide exchange factor GrpE [Deltaproteobacteria bacterium]